MLFREKYELEIIVAGAALPGTLELYNVVLDKGFRSNACGDEWRLQEHTQCGDGWRLQGSIQHSDGLKASRTEGAHSVK